MGDADLLSGFAEQKPLTISDLNARIRVTLEGAFEEVLVEGEIGNFTRAASGHLYFTLKDERSQVRCVMFRGRALYLRFEPETGMKVIVRAILTVYEPRGEYQLTVSIIEPAGIGALQLAFEQLKLKLAQEGLFDPERKKPLPFLPRRLGIVTSPTGAAIRDILTVLKRRYPNIHVTIFPALVQGADAPPQIVEGIKVLDETKAFDVIIVTRGGGSMEDLWAFNDERVARAIAACRTPLISAVGHEIDFTISDFVADMRAPTPSAAAEMVVGRKDELLETLRVLNHRMVNAIGNQIRQIRTVLKAASPERILTSIKRSHQTESQRVDELSRRLTSGMQAAEALGKQQLAKVAAALEALNPLGALRRGYAIASKKGDNIPLASIRGIASGDELDLRLSDGTAACSVLGTKKESSSE